MQSIPILTESDIKASLPPVREIVDALTDVFRRRGEGKISVTSKMAAAGAQGGFFHAMPAIVGDIAVVKWVASGHRPGNPYLFATLIASALDSGRTLAVMDYNWVTGVRTAAVSALGARLLARPEVRSLSIFGSGLQAITHIDAFAALHPIKRVTVVARSASSAEAFRQSFKRAELDISVVTNACPDFYEADVVISATPLKLPPALDADRLKPGALLIAIDLADAWRVPTLDALDGLFTDDIAHYRGLDHRGHTHPSIEFTGDLGSLLRNGASSRWQPDRRYGFVPPGMALADAVIAELLLKKRGLL
ncbi:MAG: hypothetical protein AB7F74_04830 [Parvibaculaceae bacterium]